MKQIKAGSLSGSLISAFIKGFTTFTDLGRYVGSSIRRLVNKNMCNF